MYVAVFIMKLFMDICGCVCFIMNMIIIIIINNKLNKFNILTKCAVGSRHSGLIHSLSQFGCEKGVASNSLFNDLLLLKNNHKINSFLRSSHRNTSDLTYFCLAWVQQCKNLILHVNLDLNTFIIVFYKVIFSSNWQISSLRFLLTLMLLPKFFCSLLFLCRSIF